MNNNDLISRVAAIDALTDNNIKKNSDNVYDGELHRTKRAAIRIIANMPAVDAEPIRHGRWIKMTESPEWDQKRCSVCGDISCCQRNYCPNCGTKMDGGNDDA